MHAFRRSLYALLIFEMLSCCYVNSQGTPSITYSSIKATDFDKSDSVLLLVTSDIPAASKDVRPLRVSPTNFLWTRWTLKFTPGKKIVSVKVSRPKIL